MPAVSLRADPGRRTPDVGSVPGCTYRGGVYRFLLTPRWWGINIFAVLAIPVCLLMGSWQLGRFDARVENHRSSRSGRRGGERPRRARWPTAARAPADTGGAPRRSPDASTPRAPCWYPAVRSGRGASTSCLCCAPRRGKSDARGRARARARRRCPSCAVGCRARADPAKVPPAPQGRGRVTGVLQATEAQNDAAEGATGGTLPDGQLGYDQRGGPRQRRPLPGTGRVDHRAAHRQPLRPVPPVAPAEPAST